MKQPQRDDEGYLRGWFLVETHGNYKRAREMARQRIRGGYTKFKLTENQLRFLSGIVGGRRNSGFGPTIDVLMRHGLVSAFEGNLHPTDAGREALTQARSEGW